MAIEVRRVAGGFAAEVLGADPARDADFPDIHRAFLDHGVIVIRAQAQTPLAPEAQIAFSGRFGPLMGRRPSTPDKVLMPGHPEIILLSNRRVKGEKVGISDAGRYWHSDLCFEEKPNLGTVVHAVEIPPEGGDTLFADLEGAYAALPDDLKARIEGKRAAHTFRKHYLEVMAEGSDRPPLTPEQIDALAETYHPIARTHPETGRKTLFINPGHTTHVEGLGAAESRDLLDALYAVCLAPEHIYRHKWRVGDTVVWDNRRVMHNAEPYDMARYTRHMHRCSIHGDKPF
ncbi:MAG: TauD/TfdA family dioxygenase [Rhodospirillaceae bacterium]|nr:TauD/TfdA family dioxygenase [Rhodospirillaceae bacterium]